MEKPPRLLDAHGRPLGEKQEKEKPKLIIPDSGHGTRSAQEQENYQQIIRETKDDVELRKKYNSWRRSWITKNMGKMRENIAQAEKSNDEISAAKFEGYIREMEQGEVPQEYVPQKYLTLREEAPSVASPETLSTEPLLLRQDWLVSPEEGNLSSEQASSEEGDVPTFSQEAQHAVADFLSNPQTPEAEISERQKNLWEYRESQNALDQATKDFYSKNFVGRAWTKLANWAGKENELSTLNVAQERFDQASDERQKHVEDRFTNFLTKHPNLSDSEKTEALLRISSRRIEREGLRGEKNQAEALKPQSYLGKKWQNLKPWQKRAIMASGAAGVAFTTGGLAPTIGGVATLAGRMALGGLAGNLAARLVEKVGKRHTQNLQARQAAEMKKLDFDDEELKGANLSSALRGQFDRLTRTKRQWGRATTGAALVTGFLAGLQYNDMVAGVPGLEAPTPNPHPPVFEAPTPNPHPPVFEAPTPSPHPEIVPEIDLTPGEEVVVDHPDGTKTVERLGNFETTDLADHISFSEYKVANGEGMWHVIQNGILDHGNYSALEHTERSNYTMNAFERLQGPEYSELRSELGLDGNLQLDRGEVFTAEEMTKLHDAIKEMTITHEGESLTLAERADQLTEGQRENIVAVEDRIEKGDTGAMDYETMGPGNQAELEASPAVNTPPNPDETYTADMFNPDGSLSSSGTGTEGPTLAALGDSGEYTADMFNPDGSLAGSESVVASEALSSPTLMMMQNTQEALASAGVETTSIEQVVDGKQVINLADGRTVTVTENQIEATNSEGLVTVVEQPRSGLLGLGRENPEATATRFVSKLTQTA